MSDRELAEKLFPSAPGKTTFKMPDYAHVHREMQRHGVTLTLLWMEYCDQCKAEGSIPYQSTQFNKYYSDYLNRINATMHLNHKPGDIMQVDWAGDTAAVVDTDTGEIIPAYVFVATLPYSGYSYVEAFFFHGSGGLDAGSRQCISLLWRRYPNDSVRQPENRCRKTQP